MKKVGIIALLVIIGIGVAYFYKEKTLSSKELNPKSEEVEEQQELLKDEEISSSIFGKYYQEAVTLVSKMTLEEKVGQLFLVRYEASLVDSEKDYYPGGYLLFAKDFENHTKQTIKQEIQKDNEKNKYPLMIAVDEEGGYVTRVSRFKAFRESKFLSPRTYFEQGGYEALEQTEKEKATLLKEIGINLNLAPVADVSTNPDDFMNIRTFGRNAEETAALIKKMVEYANENQMNSCLKHFPGYGNNIDTHEEVAIDKRPYETFVQSDYLPFQAGIAAKVPAILVSHNIVTAIDETYPSSLSQKVIKELRETLKFTGIIITDDLAMDAVKNYVEQKEAATLAVNAGNDMIITSDFIPMYEEVLNAVKEGKIKEETINNRVLRIIAWKYNSGLF